MASEPRHETVFDVSVQRLAKVYAEALLIVAQKKGQATQVVEEIDSLVDDLLYKDERLKALIFGSALGVKARQTLIEQAFQGRSNEAVLHFLLVLNDHDRLSILPAIRQSLHDQVNEQADRLKVIIHSAVPLPDDLAGELKETLRKLYEKEPVLAAYVDPSLLGGMKIRIGDRQVDLTVKTRLDHLRNQLLTSSSHEIQSGRDRFSTIGSH